MKIDLKKNRRDYESIQLLIADEAKAISAYSKAISTLSSDNAELKNVLSDILDEERFHLEQLHKIGTLLDNGGTYESSDPKVNAELKKQLQK